MIPDTIVCKDYKVFILLKESTTNARNFCETPPNTLIGTRWFLSRTTKDILFFLSVLVTPNALDFVLKSPEMITSLHLLTAAPIDMSSLFAYSTKMFRLTLGEQ